VTLAKAKSWRAAGVNVLRVRSSLWHVFTLAFLYKRGVTGAFNYLYFVSGHWSISHEPVLMVIFYDGNIFHFFERSLDSH
jgi:hypothetical protein